MVDKFEKCFWGDDINGDFGKRRHQNLNVFKANIFNAILYFKFEEVSGIRLTKELEGVLMK